ncbi:hypothetical protein [Streptomyces sp. SID13031]|uniref:hypothetical protein n=1 Tax=Streptomyces sp. SID13031 TaxID=2706046 RepID=UPI0013C9FBD4|nr:hypothetical protein [Streptomyces sp. SID13031]NEA35514.1 hypothetical protein [Streptomyces sp. SID13031]
MDGGEIWDHINDSADAAWPLTVLVCGLVFMLLFRRQIGERISKIVKAKAGMVSLELDANQQANEVFGEAVPEVLARPERKAITAGPGDTAEVDGSSQTVTASGQVMGRTEAATRVDAKSGSGDPADAFAVEIDDLFARREQIEEIIRASWRAGVEVGQTTSFAEPPEPKIVWTGSKPSIVGWNVAVRPTSIRGAEGGGTPSGVESASEEFRRLEDEIRRLRASGADNLRKGMTPDYLLYLELLEKLRRLDPNSPVT